MAGGSPIQAVAGQFAEPQGRAVAPAGYTPIQQGPVYQAQYQPYQQAAPYASAQQQQQINPYTEAGLGALYAQMMAQYSRPMMRAPMQEGLGYQDPAVAYRPDMSRINESLTRVAAPVTPEEAAKYDNDGNYTGGSDGGGGDGGGDGGGAGDGGGGAGDGGGGAGDGGGDGGGGDGGGGDGGGGDGGGGDGGGGGGGGDGGGGDRAGGLLTTKKKSKLHKGIKGIKRHK